jgi:hypothetical protein
MNLRRLCLQVICALVGSLALLALSGCFGITRPTLVVESLRLEVGQRGILQIIAYQLENVQIAQVGPLGRLTYDPEVLQIQGITGANGFHVFASAIDNDQGKALFLAGFPRGSLTSGVLLELEVQAVGPSGSSTLVELTQVDLLADRDGVAFKGVELRSGRVMIRASSFE